MTRILFSNLGYARGIDGSLEHHVRYAIRNFYRGQAAQRQTLEQFRAMLSEHKPDLCCIVEIDRGSVHSARLNQIEALCNADYPFHDIADKYGEGSVLGRLPLHQGKSNAFLARREIPFRRLYFRHGTKRLIHRLSLPGGINVFFTHFSLKAPVRALQLAEMRRLVGEASGESIVLADFNIMQGFRELTPLIGDGTMTVLNREEDHTFVFHRRKLALDLCVSTARLAARTTVRILPQPFSDHAALLVEVADK